MAWLRNHSRKNKGNERNRRNIHFLSLLKEPDRIDIKLYFFTRRKNSTEFWLRMSLHWDKIIVFPFSVFLTSSLSPAFLLPMCKGCVLCQAWLINNGCFLWISPLGSCYDHKMPCKNRQETLKKNKGLLLTGSGNYTAYLGPYSKVPGVVFVCVCEQERQAEWA